MAETEALAGRWNGYCLMDDGPLADTERYVVAPGDQPPKLYVFAPVKWSGGDWAVVGYDGLLPDEPWPGQITYALDRINENVAIYRQQL